MVGLGFEQAAWLWLLPLALLPLLLRSGPALNNAWAAQQPRDGLSTALHWGLRATGTLALAALLLALSAPYRPEDKIERVGQGAEIVLLLDRSRSMDERFAGGRAAANAPKGTGPEALDYYHRLRHAGPQESKGKVARQVLSDFAKRRPQDLFAMIAFSTVPIPVLPFTQKSEVIQAAIQAGDVGRGLSETDIGLAMQQALSQFEGRAYTGSRIVMLVSDGGDRIEPDTRDRISHLARKLRVTVYWIYIRTSTSPGLMQDQWLDSANAPQNTDTVPEYFLHRFFQQMGTPYRAFEAENPEALQAAINEVNRLENLPITYWDTVPKRDLSNTWWWLALLAVLALMAAQRLEIKTWA
jgi:mxaC protein